MIVNEMEYEEDAHDEMRAKLVKVLRERARLLHNHLRQKV